MKKSELIEALKGLEDGEVFSITSVTYSFGVTFTDIFTIASYIVSPYGGIPVIYSLNEDWTEEDIAEEIEGLITGMDDGTLHGSLSLEGCSIVHREL